MKEIQRLREKINAVIDKVEAKLDKKKKGKPVVPVVEKSVLVEGVPDATVKPTVEGV